MKEVECKERFEYEEGYFKGVKDAQIYYRKYEIYNSKASIVISHGFCESGEKYEELIKIFNSNGYSVYILDHRGHGRSEKLGKYKNQINIEKFDYYVEDLKNFIDNQVLTNIENNKLYLYGHSMGGAISALFLEKYPNYFDAVILNAPMMTINTGKYPNLISSIVSNLACILGKGDEYVWGHGPFNHKADLLNSGTSSEIRYNTYFNKQLKYECFQTSGASFRWLKESLAATKYITNKKNASKITAPVLLFQAGKDTFVKPKGHEQFAKGAKNCKIRIFEEAKHEIYIERDEIFNLYIKELLSFYDDNLSYQVIKNINK